MPQADAQQNVERLIAWKRGGAAGLAPAPAGAGPIAVFGAGMMGTAIAAAAASRDIPVLLADADPAALERAPARIAAELAGLADPGPLSSEAALRRVTPLADDAQLADCPIVVESVPEDLQLKRALYQRLEAAMRPEAVLGSNTSTIPIAQLSQTLERPQRFCGLHFFHPVRRRPLVEIVRARRTSEATLAAAQRFASALGKLAVVVGDGPGFLVNRLLMPYFNEALDLLLEGVSPQRLESVALEFGMAMGPLRLIDEIGLDTMVLATRVFWQAMPGRALGSPLLIAMYKAGRRGRKSGAGFYLYPPELPADDPGTPDDGLRPLVAKWSRPAAAWSDEQIVLRLFLPMILEAARVLEEGLVADPREVDVGVLFGLGFPAARGGLLYWADQWGAAGVLQRLEPFRPLGNHLAPPPLLERLAAAGGRFYDLIGPDTPAKCC